ncbi:hypothetical protein EYF80_037792 [Liparis tanakae]|uniref:Uncharacterized protein n=1 Tax=Liparis tanakae TaxID=230148 RepID=A0A4Z2GEJ5_9TELE|nr:hypothetical protein EYF80_037792 [Liparis tanakae]
MLTDSGTAVISSESTTRRSFVIRTQHGAELRRNRRHLQPGPVSQPIPAAHRDVTGTDTHSDGATILETIPVSQSVATPTTPLPGQTVTRSGRKSIPPKYRNKMVEECLEDKQCLLPFRRSFFFCMFQDESGST